MRAQYFRGPFLAVHADHDTAAALCKGNAFRIQPNLYPLRFHDLAHSLRDIFIFAADQPRPHLHDGDLASKAAKHLAEFQTDVTSADDDEVLRQKINAHHGRVVQERDIFDPRHIWNGRAAAGVDIDLVGLDHLIVHDD